MKKMTIFGITVIVTVILLWVRYAIGWGNEIPTYHTENIGVYDMASHQWSEPVVPKFPVTSDMTLSFGAVGEDVPIIIERNGGKNHGGDEIKIPSRKSGIKPSFPKMNVTSARFKLSEDYAQGTAEIYYKFEPAKVH